MVINIPLQIDEEKMEELLQKDYEGRVLNEITKYIKTTLAKNASRSSYSSYYKNAEDRVDDGMKVLIEDRIDTFLKEHREEIIENASTILADKLAKSKKGKAILDGVCADAERRIDD